jgi:hypothetical protein
MEGEEEGRVEDRERKKEERGETKKISHQLRNWLSPKPPTES